VCVCYWVLFRLAYDLRTAHATGNQKEVFFFSFFFFCARFFFLRDGWTDGWLNGSLVGTGFPGCFWVVVVDEKCEGVEVGMEYIQHKRLREVQLFFCGMSDAAQVDGGGGIDFIIFNLLSSCLKSSLVGEVRGDGLALGVVGRNLCVLVSRPGSSAFEI